MPLPFTIFAPGGGFTLESFPILIIRSFLMITVPLLIIPLFGKSSSIDNIVQPLKAIIPSPLNLENVKSIFISSGSSISEKPTDNRSEINNELPRDQYTFLPPFSHFGKWVS